MDEHGCGFGLLGPGFMFALCFGFWCVFFFYYCSLVFGLLTLLLYIKGEALLKVSLKVN